MLKTFKSLSMEAPPESLNYITYINQKVWQKLGQMYKNYRKFEERENGNKPT